MTETIKRSNLGVFSGFSLGHNSHILNTTDIIRAFLQTNLYNLIGLTPNQYRPLFLKNWDRSRVLRTLYDKTKNSIPNKLFISDNYQEKIRKLLIEM